MTETQFLEAAQRVLDGVQAAVDAQDLDADCALAGLVLTIEFDGGARVVINAQAPMRQIWLAARSGARHFAAQGGGWADTRTGEDFYAVLSRVLGEHAGRAVALRPA
jgi:CyaY protein